LSEKELREKAERQNLANEIKLKKFNEIQAENKRKQKIIQDKMAELGKLKEEVE
jgi:hypothetical protein